MKPIDIVIIVIVCVCFLIALTISFRKKKHCSNCCGCIYSDTCKDKKTNTKITEADKTN